MTDKTQMELIAALEKATGPDRELDAQIAMATRGDEMPKDYYFWQSSRTKGSKPKDEIVFWRGRARPFTASIDAAMTLAVRGWIVSVERGFDDDGEYWSKVIVADSHSVERGCDPSDRIEFMSAGRGEPPQYIAAAWLKARASLTKGAQ